MYEHVVLEKYRVDSAGTHLQIMIPDKDVSYYITDKKAKAESFGLMMAGIFPQSSVRRYTLLSGIFRTGLDMSRKNRKNG